MPKISVIMPSLNVAGFIRQSIESVMNQTLNDIEIICVDAGSVDGTIEIIHELQNSDNRIKLILSDRKSYGYQMNIGIDAASGEYIGIVETDDWVSSNMFQHLWKAASENNADIVKSNYCWYYTQPSVIDKPYENLSQCKYEVVFSPEKDMSIFSSTPAIWSGIYRSSFLRQHNIRFNETPGASFQDSSFHFMVLTMAERVYLINEYLLHYRKDNENSSVHSDSKVFCVSDEMHYYESFLEMHPDKKAVFAEPYIAWKYEKYRWNFERLQPQQQWSFLSLFRQEFLEAQQASLLSAEKLGDAVFEKISLLIDRPLVFFSQYAKIYATRPQDDQLPAADILHNSQVENPDISVIIPGYNAEDFVSRSISSVQQQTLKNIEIVCVDDGSKDNTLSIMLEYAEKDDRIAVLHQVNLGLSGARNAGMKAARGRFICFLDSDDTLREDALEFLVKESDEKNLDILYFDGKTIFESTDLEESNPYYLHAYEFAIDLPSPIAGSEYFIRAKTLNKYRASACMASFRRSFLSELGLSFIVGIYQEDNVFTFISMLSAARVWHTQEQFYYRYLLQGSIMTQAKSFQHFYGYLASTIHLFTYAQSLPYDPLLNKYVENEIQNLAWHTQNVFSQLNNQSDCVRILSDTERLFFNRFIKEHGNNSEITRIKSSRSYKLGMFLTTPWRKIRGFVHCWKAHGLRFTVSKYYKGLFGGGQAPVKPLFVSSDAYKMSGAFLSLIALNKELNDRFQIPSQIILPYWGSGNSLVKEAGIKNQVVKSSDWIVPVGEKTDLLFHANKAIQRTENIYAAVRIAREALRADYSLIHTNSSYTGVGYLAARIASLPHIWHLREFLEEDQSKQIYCKRRGYRMIRHSTQVIAISRSLYNKYASIVPAQRLRLIYNGIRPEQYYLPNKQIFQKDTPVFLFVSGSSAPEKGRQTLINACSQLKKEGVDFSLWFVGWCGPALQEQIMQNDLADRTKFFGYQKNTESYYKAADIFFMCSKFEAFGRTTVEAMMAGCLVIGANTAGTSELIQEKENGLLYEYGDADDLCAKIRYALRNRSEMKTIAARGQTNAYHNLSAAANAESVLNLYNQVLSSRKKKGKITKWFLLRRADFVAVYCRLRRCTVDRICRALIASKSHKPNNEKGQKEIAKKVSIIVPVYNVEKYLKQCLDSIVGQTLREIEIICVNDGSTDSSKTILQEYADKDNRIIIIDKKNSGYGASVNMGLDKATGIYVAIVETDDFLDSHMMEDLYNKAVEKGTVDIIKSSYWLFYDTEDGKGKTENAPILSACHPPEEVFDVWTYPEIVYHHPSIWSCLYKRSFIEEHHIRFVEAPGAGWVDNPFLLETFCQAKRITWVPQAYYYYRQTNPQASSFIKDCSIPFLRTKEMLEFLNSHGIVSIDIVGSVYKRILWNAAATLENPHYVPELHDDIIIDQLKRIPASFLSESRVQQKEREAYSYFICK